MLIPLKRSGDLEEWAIIELQGDLKFDSFDKSNDQFIGSLHFTKTGAPILIIGIYVLHGKETSLPKPFAVLKKKKPEVTEENEENSTEYTIAAIVKRKLIFRTRPKPIITNVPKCI